MYGDIPRFLLKSQTGNPFDSVNRENAVFPDRTRGEDHKRTYLFLAALPVENSQYTAELRAVSCVHAW